jgi:predicted small lipoprotein YifL
MRLVLLLILSALFAGCGQRGPLYLPEDPDAATAPQDPAAESLSEPAEEDQEEDDAPEP